MKSVLAILNLLGLTLLITACSTVTSKIPVGDKPLQLKAEDWNGIWQTVDQRPFYLRVAEAEKGILKLAWVSEKKGVWVLEQYVVFLRQTGDTVYGNAREERPEDNKPAQTDAGFLFAKVKIQTGDNTVVIWPPRFDTFRRALEDKSLDGILQEGRFGGTIILTSDEKIRSYFESPEAISLFVLEEPLVLRRIHKDFGL